MIGRFALLGWMLLASVAAQGRWIVRMKRYAAASEHVSYVRGALFDFDVAVGSAALHFPTDFVVVECDRREGERTRDVLASNDAVAAVNEDHSVGGGRTILAPMAGAQQRLSGVERLDELFAVRALHERGILGQGVRIAIFDTGLSAPDPSFLHRVNVTDWTSENQTHDRVGHGTFIAGVIAGTMTGCSGLAPQALITTYRIFTGTQTSYTSWFLDAFNHVMHTGADVVTLAIGGPDNMDEPFVDKVNEVSAAGIVIVSAIGNDGPIYGTLSNPADMMEVVGIGGVERDGRIAPFSSRGMTTQELALARPSYGRTKPDLVTISRDLRGPSVRFQRCIKLSGTSVAAPVVTAAIALLLSVVPAEQRRHVANPASIKRALVQGARRLPNANMFEQGAGLLDVPLSVEAMRNMTRDFERSGEIPLQLMPSYLDLTPDGCPYMWPFCAQPLFATMQPLTVNVTILNPNAVESELTRVAWVPGRNGQHLDIRFVRPQRFWPWAGGLGVRIGAASASFEGISEGLIDVSVRSLPGGPTLSARLPIRAHVVPTPPRTRRVLWDVAHNLVYPPAFIPKDNLDHKDPLDWLGDHPHTNYNEFFRALLRRGFFVEIWDQPLDCLSADLLRNYGVLIVADPEADFTADEVRAFEAAVRDGGLVALVIAEWYDPSWMAKLEFNDENTRSRWRPVGAGANVPSINRLLEPFQVALGGRVYEGHFTPRLMRYPYKSGSSIVAFPASGRVVASRAATERGSPEEAQVAVFGVLSLDSGGGLIVLGDSTCVDSETPAMRCHSFVIDAINCTLRGNIDELEGDLMPGNATHVHGARAPELPADTARLLAPHVARNRQLRGCVPRRPVTEADEVGPPLTDEVVLPAVRYADLTSLSHSTVGKAGTDPLFVGAVVKVMVLVAGAIAVAIVLMGRYHTRLARLAAGALRNGTRALRERIARRQARPRARRE